MPPTLLDKQALAALFAPGGRWAKERGSYVRERRIAAGIKPQELADLCDVKLPTIYRVESGALIPSNQLRASIAYRLSTRPEVIWTYPSSLELELVSQAGAPA